MYQYANPLLTLENVNLSFGSKKVLIDVNLQIKDVIRQGVTGQIITLLGPSGVGKTQLLKMIAGLQQPTSGTILIGEEQVPVTQGIAGMVLQSYPLFEHRTILSNLQLVSKDLEKIYFFLEEFDITDIMGKYPPQCSGGQRQRAAIVQQLLCSDKFILFDEPFSGLDPLATAKLCANIQKVAHMDSLNTVVISTHILEPALAISDQMIMLGKTVGVEGATIIKNDNLADLGLAWNPDALSCTQFTDYVNEIRKEENWRAKS